MTSTVLWLRRDLRLHDHPALLAAAQDAGGSGVLPLFVLDPALLDPAGPSRTAWLFRSLRAWSDSADGALVVRTGRPAGSVGCDHPHRREPGSSPVGRVVVDVMPKPEILDPQGKAVAGALPRLGFGPFTSVRQGKRFELEVDGPVTPEVLAAAAQAAEQVLSNPVIEDVVRVADAEADAAATVLSEGLA